MLKVFVSTRATQGDQPGDFCWVPTDELVGRYAMVCDSERPDGSGCGCGRAFSGFTTHKGTTTAMVVERDMTVGELSVGSVVGRRAWNDARGTLDHLTFRGLAEVDVGRAV